MFTQICIKEMAGGPLRNSGTKPWGRRDVPQVFDFFFLPDYFFFTTNISPSPSPHFCTI